MYSNRCSSSPARPFRHTSTLIGLEIVSALVEVAKRVQPDLTTAQRQLNTEQKKSGSQNAKIRQMTETANRLQDNIAKLERAMDEIFLG